MTESPTPAPRDDTAGEALACTGCWTHPYGDPPRPGVPSSNDTCTPAPAPPGGDDGRVECRSCGHWKRHHDGNGCNVVAGTADGLGDAPCPCARFAAPPGGDDGAAAGDHARLNAAAWEFAGELSDEIADLTAARDAALAEAARARAEVEGLRAIRDAVMECPDDQRRELYRADLIAGKAIIEAERLRLENARLAAALGRVEALVSAWMDDSREWYHDNRHTHQNGIDWCAGFEDGWDHATDLLRATLSPLPGTGVQP